MMDGKIGNAELDLNGAKLYVADAGYEASEKRELSKPAPILLHADVPESMPLS